MQKEVPAVAPNLRLRTCYLSQLGISLDRYNPPDLDRWRREMKGSASVKSIAFLALFTVVTATLLPLCPASGELVSRLSERHLAVAQIKLAAYDAAWSYLLGAGGSSSDE